MPQNNQDGGIPQTPAFNPDEKNIPVLWDNFTQAGPVNPILWGPGQAWLGIGTYSQPSRWRGKELLSIPRVVRFGFAVTDPCDTGSVLQDGDFLIDNIQCEDGFALINLQWVVVGGEKLFGQFIKVASDSSEYSEDAIANITSLDFLDNCPLIRDGSPTTGSYEGDPPNTMMTIDGYGSFGEPPP